MLSSWQKTVCVHNYTVNRSTFSGNKPCTVGGGFAEPLSPYYTTVCVFFMSHWQISPTQMKWTCNANNFTYITLCFSIRIRYFGGHTSMLCTFFHKTCWAAWLWISFKCTQCELCCVFSHNAMLKTHSVGLLRALESNKKTIKDRQQSWRAVFVFLWLLPEFIRYNNILYIIWKGIFFPYSIM